MTPSDHIAALMATDATLKQAEAKAALLKLPLLTFPDDYCLLTGQGRSAAFDTRKKDPSFPAVIKVGGSRFLRTKDFLAWIMGKDADPEGTL